MCILPHLMEILVGSVIAVINQLLLCWRMNRLKSNNVTRPKQVVNAGRISLIERLVLIGILLAVAMMNFDPLTIILSFFFINFGLVYFIKCQAKL